MKNELPTLKIGYLPILDHLILPIAQHNQNNQFEKFELKSKEYLNWETVSKDLVDDKLDVAFLLAPLAMELFRQKYSLKIVLLGHREGQVLVTSPLINHLSGLKGKTIHLPYKFSTHHILLAQAFDAEKKNLQQDTKIVFGYDNIKMAADELVNKKTDAFMLAEPMGTEAVKRKIGKFLKISQEILPHHIDCVLVVNKKLADKKPEIIQELVDSFVSAGAFINAYPRQAAEIGAKVFGWSTKIMLEALTHHRSHILFWDLVPRLEDFEQLQKIAIDTINLWHEPINLSELVNAEFAHEAYRKLVINTRISSKDRGSSNTLPTNTIEAISCLESIMGKPSIAVGISRIEFGHRYPSQAKQIELSQESLTSLLEKITLNQNFLFSNISGLKALALVKLNKESNPDSILLQINDEELKKIEQFLTISDKNHQLEIVKQLDDFLVSDQLAKYKEKDKIFLILPWKSFRFLILQLENSD